MKAWDYRAVVYDGNVYCVEHVPDNARDELVQPIFVSDEWDYYPICDVCGREHDYVGLTTEGAH